MALFVQVVVCRHHFLRDALHCRQRLEEVLRIEQTSELLGLRSQVGSAVTLKLRPDLLGREAGLADRGQPVVVQALADLVNLIVRLFQRSAAPSKGVHAVVRRSRFDGSQRFPILLHDL